MMVAPTVVLKIYVPFSGMTFDWNQDIRPDPIAPKPCPTGMTLCVTTNAGAGGSYPRSAENAPRGGS